MEFVVIWICKLFFFVFYVGLVDWFFWGYFRVWIGVKCVLCVFELVVSFFCFIWWLKLFFEYVNEEIVLVRIFLIIVYVKLLIGWF